MKAKLVNGNGLEPLGVTEGGIYTVQTIPPAEKYIVLNDHNQVVHIQATRFELVATVAEYEEHKAQVDALVKRKKLEEAAQYIAHQVKAPEVQALLIYSLVTR